MSAIAMISVSGVLDVFLCKKSFTSLLRSIFCLNYKHLMASMIIEEVGAIDFLPPYLNPMEMTFLK